MSVPLLLLAADFWKQKEPSEWTSKEIIQMLTKSPWAKEAGTNLNPALAGGTGRSGGGSRGGGMGRGGGGGGGGRGGMGGGGMDDMGESASGRGVREGMPASKFTVRWASAEPVRRAASRTNAQIANLAEWSQQFYVIVVIGAPPRENSTVQEDTARQQRFKQRLQQATSFQRKGKDLIPPERVELLQTSEGQVAVFFFPRTVGLSADTKEVIFQSAMGPVEIKARFNLADMVYHGKLDL
jgi:hypothetical protein